MKKIKDHSSGRQEAKRTKDVQKTMWRFVFVFSSLVFLSGVSFACFLPRRRVQNKKYNQPHFAATKAGEGEKARAPLHSRRRGSTNVTDLLGCAVQGARTIIFCTCPSVSLFFSTLRQDCPRSVSQFAARHPSEEWSRAAFLPMRC